MNATRIKPDIYWVGAIDWAVRDFHGYMTPNGTTYNNYLIMDEKITLLDTVKHDFSEIMLDNVTEIVHPSKIEYVIIMHRGSRAHPRRHRSGDDARPTRAD